MSTTSHFVLALNSSGERLYYCLPSHWISTWSRRIEDAYLFPVGLASDSWIKLIGDQLMSGCFDELHPLPDRLLFHLSGDFRLVQIPVFVDLEEVSGHE